MKTLSYGVVLATLLSTTIIPAYAASDADVAALRKEIQAIRQAYESRITDLEKKLSEVERTKTNAALAPAAGPAPARQSSVTPATTSRDIRNNSFNPSIGVILNGQYRSFSEDEGDIAGFAVGHEGERGKGGLSVEHTELNFSANVDDKFYGSATAAIAEHDGETEIELEEALVQTLPGMGLPTGATLKAGRALWTLGYLNEHHTHADDFADRPLPYRVFLDNAFNDDGVEFTYILPTNFYSEVGGGIFRGDDYPFGSASGDGIGAWSGFARVGGDIGDNQNWRVGGYVLSGDTGGRLSNEDVVNFTGDTHLYAADVRYTWAPTGNQSWRTLTPGQWKSWGQL